MKTAILDLDYNKYVSILGTAHFTRRSLQEACEAVRKLKPTDLAIELDMRRFHILTRQCASCPRQESCSGKCEFTGAADAVGNTDLNIWLIDMTEEEISHRIRQLLPSNRLWRFSFPRIFHWIGDENDEIWLWENGYKQEVLKRHARRMKILKARAPHVWKVLIDERNTLMAARLAWIVTRKVTIGEDAEVLALTGAAHVSGIRELLGNPKEIGEELMKKRLTFTNPTLIRRTRVN